MTDNVAASAKQALLNSGTLTEEENARVIINGAKTLTPIVAKLTREGKAGSKDDFNSLLSFIQLLQSSLVKSALEANYNVTNLHYVSLSRLAISLACETGIKNHEDNIDIISRICIELFDLEKIHADSMLGELTEDDFALQFIGISKLTSVILKHLIKCGNDNYEDDLLDILNNTISCVDKHIDDISDKFINGSTAPLIRNQLLLCASEIFDAILAYTQQDSSLHPVNIPLVNKLFEQAYEPYIQAITVKAELKGQGHA